MTSESPGTVEHLIERLSQHRVDLTTTLEMMQGYAQQVDTAAQELENPQAVKEYLTYFATLFTQAATECQRGGSPGFANLSRCRPFHLEAVRAPLSRPGVLPATV